MGFVASTFRAVIPSARSMTAQVPVWQNGVAQLPQANYQTFAREGYMNNELVYACIDELATTAAEPRMMARSGQTWRHTGDICDLLNNPNPFMDSFQFWATIIMHLSLAGNAYALKVRSGSGKVVELWLMRPDRVRIVPSTSSYIGHYIYNVGGGDFVNIPAEDVIHWKERHPLDDWYGMPPLMAISGRTDLDNYMKDFQKSAFLNGGMPGAVLSIKQKVSPEDKQAIGDRFRNKFGGPNGWHELLILDNAESSYTPMSMSLGNQGLVIPELDMIAVERICSVFHVFPPLIGYMKDTGGYNSLFALERHWWTSTLMPLYQSLAGPLNLRLVPEFPRINELKFDMTLVLALQEDQDKLAIRWGKLAQTGVASVQEAREKVGLPPEWESTAVFLVPSSSVATTGDDLEEPEPEEPAQVAAPEPVRALPAARNVGRPRIIDDPEARAAWQEWSQLQLTHSGITYRQGAMYLAISERTLQRYDKAFGSDS